MVAYWTCRGCERIDALFCCLGPLRFKGLRVARRSERRPLVWSCFRGWPTPSTAGTSFRAYKWALACCDIHSGAPSSERNAHDSGSIRFEGTASGYQELLHGEGVAIGMLCASRLAELLGRVDSVTTQRQFDLLSALQLPTQMPDLDPEELLRLMYHDKKTNSGDLRFVLPSRIGHVELVDNVRDEQVLSALVNPA